MSDDNGATQYSLDGLEFFRARAIDPQVAAQVGVREDRGGPNFPYGEEGERFWRHRSLNGGGGPKVTQPKGKPLTLWWPGGLARDNSMVLVTEGESDNLAAMSALRHSPIADLAGLPVVAIPGTGFPADRLADQLSKAGVAQAWLALDADDAGRKHTDKVIPELVGKGIVAVPVFLPDGTDLADCLASTETETRRGEWLASLLCDAAAATDGEASMDGAQALEALESYIARYVVLSSAQLAAVALWVMHTHVFEVAEATPYLAIGSAEKESGKTRLLETLEPVVAKPWLTGRITAAVLARKVDVQQPTLLLDESDAAFNGEKEYAEALRGLLNTGYRASGCSTLCVGQGAKIEFKDFSTFCPKAIAGIGKLPATVASRSIAVTLKRRAPGERVEPFRLRAVRAAASPLREQLEAWATENSDALVDAEPIAPQELGDRAADCWEPLLAIADVAGGSWPERAQSAAVELAGGAAAEDDSLGVLLLADLKAIFDERGTRALFTKDLVVALNALEESPWGERRRGDGMSTNDLRKRLKSHEIKSRTVRVGSDTAKGYHREQLEDLWDRYLPAPPSPEKPSQASQPSQPAPHRACDVTDVTDVTANTGMGEQEALVEEEAELERLRNKFGEP